MKLLVLDNYDSFTYNLVQYLGELGASADVVRNDRITVAQIAAEPPERIVISPGPCTPDEAGISVELVRELGARIPILGVCLGALGLLEPVYAAVFQVIGAIIVALNSAKLIRQGEQLEDILHE